MRKPLEVLYSEAANRAGVLAQQDAGQNEKRKFWQQVIVADVPASKFMSC